MIILILILILIIIFILYNNIKPKLECFIPYHKSIIIQYHKSIIIHIWQGDTYNKLLKYMYNPIIISLVKILNNIYNNITIDYKIDYYNFEEIKQNDVLLWVGCERIPDFNYLKSKNIYTIFYNTEPDTTNTNSNEIWTYSKYLLSKYIKFDKQIIRFIPIICEDTNHYVPYNLKNDNNLKLIFMGNLGFRQDKQKEILKNPIIKDNLIEIYNIWNDTDYNNLISNKPNIYLNLTKTGTNILPTVRINKLLSHKCIIISEHTNEIDEEYYKDIIYFCNINEIGNIYQNLLLKSPEELYIESNIKYNKFYNIFNHKNAVNLIETS